MIFYIFSKISTFSKTIIDSPHWITFKTFCMPVIRLNVSSIRIFHYIIVIFYIFKISPSFILFYSNIPPPCLFSSLRARKQEDGSERESQSRFGLRGRGESSRFSHYITGYVPGDVTSRANSRGSYGNGAANTKPKSIRCTRQHIARGARGALSC